MRLAELNREVAVSIQMKSTRLSRELHSEKEVADAHMGDFIVEKSRGWHLVRTIAKTEDLPFLELLRIAQILSIISNIRFPRDMQRRRGLIIKWIDDNIEMFIPYASIIDVAPGPDSN
jgi:hypothetical protein